MMSDPTSVDKTTVDELTGKLVLVIEERRAWSEPNIMHRQLAAKVKNYVRHTRSPEFSLEHGVPPQGVIIRLVTGQPPSDVSLQFFERVAYELDKHGLFFEHQLGDEGIPVSVTPSADATVPPRVPQAPAAGPPPAAPPPRPTAPSEPAEPTGVELEPSMPGEPTGRKAPLEEEASELEKLIERDGEGLDLVGVGAPGPPESLPEGQKRYPPFFPEEEFGRAMPDMDEVEAIMGMDADATTAIIETADGKRIRLDAPGAVDKAIAAAVQGEPRPSLLRGVAAALVTGVVGAIIWVLLAIPAGTGASPLAVAVAVMVGFSVRVRGSGHTMVFRVLGILGTLFGSALGSVGAAAALTAMETDAGLGSILQIISDPEALLAAYTSQFTLIDLISLVLAAYVAFRISASKAPSQ